MRRLFLSLRWEMLGKYPAVITLTYPGDWEQWVPDGRVWQRHLKAFERRWVRRWGTPLIGVWVKEFQNRGAPHLHLYVGLPETMAADDFGGLRRRTLLRRRLEGDFGRHGGRRRLPAIGGKYGGEFGMWLRTAWSEIVGTQGVVQAHHARGADVAVMFWSDEVALTADRVRVAVYLAKEAAKFVQKSPPAGFVGVGRYYGTWGSHSGFEPVEEEVELDPQVAELVERVLARWVRLKMRAKGWHPSKGKGFAARRSGDGVTAFGLGPEEAGRIVWWAEVEAMRRGAPTPSEGVGGMSRG